MVLKAEVMEEEATGSRCTVTLVVFIFIIRFFLLVF
jgi:hypothetical protein